MIKKNDPVLFKETIDEALDQVKMGSPLKSLTMSPEEIRRTAIHESGHAICALFAEGGDKIYKATIVPRGLALGMVSFVPNSEVSMTKRQVFFANLYSFDPFFPSKLQQLIKNSPIKSCLLEWFVPWEDGRQRRLFMEA